MRTITILAAAGLLASPAQTWAKRIPAPKVEPVLYEGIRYAAPNNNGRRAYIEAWDERSGKKLWAKTIFRNWIWPWLEEDVQWVYIQELRVQNDKLIVIAERERRYSMDLKTGKIRKLKSDAGRESRR
jgi:hypothetical protein